MINIAFCDDEEYAHKTFKRLMGEYEGIYEEIFNIYCFYSADDFLKSDISFDIIFLDIEMPGIDGIELGKIINSYKPKPKIIMFTARGEKYKEAFKINAFRFVTKPVDKNEFNEALHAAFISIRGVDDVSVLYSGLKTTIKQRDIVFIESCGDYVKLYTIDKVFEKNISIKNLLEELYDMLFVQCHKRYVANMMFVSDILKHKFVLETSIVEKNKYDIIPISRRRWEEVKKIYMKFDTGEL